MGSLNRCNQNELSPSTSLVKRFLTGCKENNRTDAINHDKGMYCSRRTLQNISNFIVVGLG